MARKGVLVSSPDMAKMTPLRWYFEFLSLKRKETDQVKLYRRVATMLLGLNLFSKTRLNKNKEQDIDTDEMYLPLTAFLNQGINEQLLKEYFEDMDIEATMDEEWEKKLDDPDSLIAELEIVDFKDRKWVVEEGAPVDSFAPMPEKKIKIDGDA